MYSKDENYNSLYVLVILWDWLGIFRVMVQTRVTMYVPFWVAVPLIKLEFTALMRMEG